MNIKCEIKSPIPSSIPLNRTTPGQVVRFRKHICLVICNDNVGNRGLVCLTDPYVTWTNNLQPTDTVEPIGTFSCTVSE